jgi:hypothetical protein
VDPSDVDDIAELVVPPSAAARDPLLTGCGPEPSDAVHVHAAGQSLSVEQVVAFGWQVPGNDVADVQLGAAPPSTVGAGAIGPASA